MSLASLANMCAHLNNVTKARLGLTSLPSTKMHLKLLLSMQSQGLIGSVVRAGKAPPPPHFLTGQPAVGGNLVDVEPVTQENIASRRLWLGLKYWQSDPVLGKLTPISKPKHRINLDVPGLRQVLTGQRSGRVDGLRSPGECLFLTTDQGVLEARECIEKKSEADADAENHPRPRCRVNPEVRFPLQQQQSPAARNKIVEDMASSVPVDNTPRKRRRPALACEQCRRRKLRCDRKLPCAPCTRSRESLTCSYSPSHFSQDNASDFIGDPSPAAISRREEGRKRSFTSAFSTEANTNAGDLGESSNPDAPPAQTAQIIEDLQHRIRQLEGFASAGRVADQLQFGLGPSPTSATPARRTIYHPHPAGQETSSQPRPNEVHRDSPITAPVPRLRVSSQKTKLFGPNHWVNTAAQLQIIGEFSPKDIEFSFAKDSAAEFSTILKDCFSIRQSWKAQMSNENILPTMDLPSTFPHRELCDELVHCYIRTFEPIYNLVHIPTFWKEYGQFWTDPATSSTSFLTKLSLVFAIGTIFRKDDKTRKYLERLARQWVYAAQWWLIGPSESSTFNMDGLQICCLIILSRQAGCLSSPLWTSTDSMLRMAMMMGLHRNTSLFSNLSPFQAEMRNRLWTTVVELYIQSVMDSGVPCLLSVEDVDSVSPSNINDDDIYPETKTHVKSESDQTFTDSSIQILFARSVRLRLEVARLINKTVRENLTYENALRLGKELQIACREISAFFQEHKSALESQGGKLTDFHHKFLDMLMRRYILLLHRPFMIEARKDPRYYLSRKICVESCLLISSYTERLDMASDYQKDLSCLTLSANASFKGALCMDFISVLGLEIKMQIEEENSFGAPNTPHSGSDPLDEMTKANRAPILKCLECIHHQLEQTLEFGIPGFKRYNYLAGVFALVRAKESGLPVKQTVYADIRASLKKCFDLLQKAKANDESSNNIATEPMPSDIEDLTSLLPMEDWNLGLGMSFSDYLGFPGFVEQPSSYAW